MPGGCRPPRTRTGQEPPSSAIPWLRTGAAPLKHPAQTPRSVGRPRPPHRGGFPSSPNTEVRGESVISPRTSMFSMGVIRVRDSGHCLPTPRNVPSGSSGPGSPLAGPRREVAPGTRTSARPTTRPLGSGSAPPPHRHPLRTPRRATAGTPRSGPASGDPPPDDGPGSPRAPPHRRPGSPHEPCARSRCTAAHRSPGDSPNAAPW